MISRIIVSIAATILTGFLSGSISQVAAQPCQDYACDTLVVRSILDANDANTLGVATVSDSSGGRITVLRLRDASLTLTVLPNEVSRLAALCTLDMSENRLDTISDALMQLSSLRQVMVWQSWSMMSGPAASPQLIVWLDSVYAWWLAPVTVLTPREGQVCTLGVPVLVTWTADPQFVAFVEVLFSPDWGEEWFGLNRTGLIYRDDPQWNAFEFVPAAVTDSFSCLIRVGQWNEYRVHGYSGCFRVVEPSMSVTPRSLTRPGEIAGGRATSYTLCGRRLSDSQRSLERISPRIVVQQSAAGESSMKLVSW